MSLLIFPNFMQFKSKVRAIDLVLMRFSSGRVLNVIVLIVK